MRTVNRRELNHHSGRILDEVLDTGEPVEVTTRGRESVVISPRPAPTSVYEDWKRRGLVVPGTGRLDEAPRASSPRSVEEILGSIRSDH